MTTLIKSEIDYKKTRMLAKKEKNVEEKYSWINLKPTKLLRLPLFIIKTWYTSQLLIICVTILKESKREEALVAHLLRQSQFERRIAVELLHARHEKDVIRENRVNKEKEILERREKEFQEALDKERVIIVFDDFCHKK